MVKRSLRAGYKRWGVCYRMRSGRQKNWLIYDWEGNKPVPDIDGPVEIRKEGAHDYPIGPLISGRIKWIPSGFQLRL